MFMHFIKSLNWVDILMLALALRLVYIGLQTGIVTEIFKIFGLVLALFFSFQYFALVASVIKMVKIPEGIIFTVAFLVIWCFMELACMLIRQGLFMIFTIQAQSAVDKWGGAIIAVFRFFVTGSMVLFAFFLTGEKYLQTKASEAASSKYIVKVAPTIYQGLSDGFVSKIFPQEKYNTAVNDALKGIR